MSEYTRIPSFDNDISSHKVDQPESGNLPGNGHSHQNGQCRIWPYLKREPLLYAVVSAFIFLLSLNIVLATSLYLKTRDVGDRYGKSHLNSIETTYFTTENDCARRLSVYSPAYDAIEYVETGLYDAFGGDEYIGRPTERTEKAWRGLWQHEAILVEDWAMPMLNRTKTDLRFYEYIETDDASGYTAWLKVYHQLACLDLIRQYSWLIGGNLSVELIPEELKKSPEENRMHVDQCIDTLRMSLMCLGDTTPMIITQDRDIKSGYRGDLNGHAKCRNFSKLQAWTESHGVEHWKTNSDFHNHDGRS
ncbi:Protein of unknown function DUF3328 [Penicillium occitanis (nom. inval.)]|nr:Protein of unknown function DUF3328 [Penicillium occitanis (nom. inval.)]PCG93057.1 hypothetical protein PENOC_089560 [Penicillium occitanis (nom. inval.)]